MLFGLEVAVCCFFFELECLVTTTDVFLCAPTGKIAAQTSASTHFLAKKVSALGSSLPIGDMKGNTSRFSQRCCLQRALLAYRLPALDKVGRGRGGLSSVLARSQSLRSGQFRRSFRTSESRSSARRLTNVDKKLMSATDSVVCLWLLFVQSLDRCHWRLLSGRQFS